MLTPISEGPVLLLGYFPCRDQPPTRVIIARDREPDILATCTMHTDRGLSAVVSIIIANNRQGDMECQTSICPYDSECVGTCRSCMDELLPPLPSARPRVSRALRPNGRPSGRPSISACQPSPWPPRPKEAVPGLPRHSGNSQGSWGHTFRLLPAGPVFSFMRTRGERMNWRWGNEPRGSGEELQAAPSRAKGCQGAPSRLALLAGLARAVQGRAGQWAWANGGGLSPGLSRCRNGERTEEVMM